MYPLEFPPIALLGLSGVLIYLGFAPNAPRWRFSLGLLGAIIACTVWWWVSSYFVPIWPRDFYRLGFAEIMTEANSRLCLTTLCIGAVLVMTLRDKRRIIAVGLGVVLPLVAGQILFGIVSERQRVNEAHRLDALQADLNQHATLWQAKHPVSYRFTVHKSFFCAPGQCPPPQTVTVAPGYVPEWTVERLFAKIQAGIDQNYDVVDATFHPTLGYPLTIHTNPDIFSEGSVFLTITDFQILQ